MVQTEILGIGAVLSIEILNGPPVEDLQLAVGQGAVSGGCHDVSIGGLCLLVGDGVAALAGHVVRVAVGGDGGFGGLGGLGGFGGFGGFGAFSDSRALRDLKLLLLVLAVQNQYSQNGGQQQHHGHAEGNGGGTGNALFHRGGLGGIRRSFLGGIRRSFLGGIRSFLHRGGLGSALRILKGGGLFGGRLLGGIRGSSCFLSGRGILRLLFSTGGADGQFLVKFLAAIMALFHGFLFSPMFGMIILPSLPCLLEKCKQKTDCLQLRDLLFCFLAVLQRMGEYAII